MSKLFNYLPNFVSQSIIAGFFKCKWFCGTRRRGLVRSFDRMEFLIFITKYKKKLSKIMCNIHFSSSLACCWFSRFSQSHAISKNVGVQRENSAGPAGQLYVPGKCLIVAYFVDVIRILIEFPIDHRQSDARSCHCRSRRSGPCICSC